MRPADTTKSLPPTHTHLIHTPKNTHVRRLSPPSRMSIPSSAAAQIQATCARRKVEGSAATHASSTSCSSLQPICVCVYDIGRRGREKGAGGVGKEGRKKERKGGWFMYFAHGTDQPLTTTTTTSVTPHEQSDRQTYKTQTDRQTHTTPPQIHTQHRHTHPPTAAAPPCHSDAAHAHHPPPASAAVGDACGAGGGAAR
jgi:hypothetical protein